MADLDASSRLGQGISLWVAADDADALHRSLADTGTVIVAPPKDGPFGRFFIFQDPDGYAITVHTAARPKT